MKMKKVLAWMLALAMCLSLAACGGSSSSDNAATKEAPPADAPAQEDAAAEETQEQAQEEAPASAESDLAYVKDKGVLVVGITDFEPMDYKDANGEWVGFDADLASQFAESLGVAVEFTEINWDNKILELNGKNIDCIWNGMTLTDEVTSAADCSNPYMLNAQVIVLPADKAGDYADVESMADLTFAVEAGSAGEAAVTDLGYNATPVTTQADALMEVAAGTSDAAVIDLLMAYAMTGEGTSYDNLVFTFTLNDEQYGVAFRQGSDLAAELNQFFADKYADGTLDNLAEIYGLAGSVIQQ
jgi:polar amino acid transport system substrate-binding protein